MKILYVILALLDICLASGRWKLDSKSCSSFDQNAIKAAVTEGITIAETAWKVLDENYATDARVQQMVKYILGDDTTLQNKINQAKAILGGVKRYDKNNNMFLDKPFFDNEDVVIFCDISNYVNKNGQQTNFAMDNTPVPPELWKNVVKCYDSTNKAGGEPLPMAITSSSDGLDFKAYKPLLDAWVKGGRVGPRPSMTAYAMPRTSNPNTIDLCTWYLEQEKAAGFSKVDKETISKIQASDFLAGLKGDDKAVDVLAQSLGATFLHELTHTNLGGKSVDNAAATGCYGWKCVGDLHDPQNADSINILGVALHVWTLGYFIDTDGTVKSIS